ncbi:SGNH/GDSL hydrolase family protein [Dermabacteraceae bacterium P13147]
MSTQSGSQQKWHRFVALGDSFTEGIGDPLPDGGHRGWADRVAEQLAAHREDFSYANLAIRGKLYQEIVDEQTDAAIALAPDLISLCAGGNDVIQRGDPDAIAAGMDDVVGRLRAETGADVILWAGPDVGHTPVLNLVRGRVAIMNENMRTVAKRHDCYLVDLWSQQQLAAEPMWAEDRLHFSPLGHHTIALEVLHTLGVAHTLEKHEVPEVPEKSWSEARSEDLAWARQHLAPWVMRRIRGESSGDEIAPKRPEATAVFGRAMPPGAGASGMEGALEEGAQ